MLAIALAARRELPVPLRGLLLALAAAALQLSVLCESRGWLFALPIVLVLTLVLVPGSDRLRFALWALPPFAGSALALPALLDVFAQADAAATAAATLQALLAPRTTPRTSRCSSAPACSSPGLALAALDRRTTVPAGVARGANRVGAGIAILAALAAIAVGFALTDGRPDRADRRLLGPLERLPGDRAGQLPLRRRRQQPAGLLARLAEGVRATARSAASARTTGARTTCASADSLEQPRWTHSFELRLLAHTGLVGFLLFAGFLAAALTAALRAVGPPPRGSARGAASRRSRCCRSSCGSCTARSTGSGRSRR